MDLEADEVRFRNIQDIFAKILDGPPANVVHVYFEPEGNISALLNAPTTSFVHIITRKPGKTAKELEEALKAVTTLPLGKGMHGGAWGKTVERDEHLMMFGWDNKDVSSFYFVGRCEMQN